MSVGAVTVMMLCVFRVVQKAAANAFAQMLRRYTGLNHLAQAARTVLQNKAQVNKMHQDLCKVDFAHMQVASVAAASTGLFVSEKLFHYYYYYY